MRILILTTYFTPDVASTGVIMSTLAEEFVARGHEVTVLTSTPHYDPDQHSLQYHGRIVYRETRIGMNIYRISSPSGGDRSRILSRIFSYARFNILSLLTGVLLPAQDVILVPSPPLSNGVIAKLLQLTHGTPFVYNVQDIWPDVAIRAGKLTNNRIIAFLRKMEAFVYRHAARLIVISGDFKANLVSKGVPGDKVSVIPNFIDLTFITPQDRNNSFRTRHGLGKSFVVLFAGNMGFSQGLETVLDCARLLQSQIDIQFLMVGNGAGRLKAEEYLRLLNLENVQFLPFQPHASLPEMYGAADLCLIPLRHGFTRDSVPCKLFTIMAAGRPAVAAVDKESETRRLIQSAKAGTCVDPEDPAALAGAILHYYEHRVEGELAGQSARLFVELQFQPSSIADNYLEMLLRAATNQRNPAKNGVLFEKPVSRESARE